MYLWRTKSDNSENGREDLRDWRKLNGIHGWFVDEVQNEVDNCEVHEVSIAKMEQFLADLKLALSQRKFCNTPEVMVPREGFFFGGTECDEYYWEEIIDTIGAIENIMKEKDWKDYHYWYCSSW